ncbi:hypothetical protein Mapa_009613 [Marchantia paleacea]|nr:hypothetical protein Mapa_009613 [Marchantia paleacea]
MSLKLRMKNGEFTYELGSLSPALYKERTLSSMDAVTQSGDMRAYGNQDVQLVYALRDGICCRATAVFPSFKTSSLDTAEINWRSSHQGSSYSRRFLSRWRRAVGIVSRVQQIICTEHTTPSESTLQDKTRTNE